MAIYYFDASGITKRYALEAGSSWVEFCTEVNSGNIILLSEITLVEVSAALAAKSRAPKGLSQEDFAKAISRFLQDCDIQYHLLSVHKNVINLAVKLALRQKLRDYDAVQLATASIVNNALIKKALIPLTFVTADDNLITAAQNEGLASENPNAYH